MYLCELENSNFKLYHSSSEHIIQYLNRIKSLRDLMISDAEKMNDEFGEPLKAEWEAFNAEVPNMNIDNLKDYEVLRDKIINKEKELWNIFHKQWTDKHNPEWHKFFKEEDSFFADVSEELVFNVYEISEFPTEFSDFNAEPMKEIDRIVMNRRYNNWED